MGHRQVAGVGAGARHDISGEFCAGLFHTELCKPLKEGAQLVFGQLAQRQVLAVGDAYLCAKVPLDRRDCTELSGGEIPELRVGDGGHFAVRFASDDVR